MKKSEIIKIIREEIELSSLVDKDRMKDAAMEGTMEGLVGLVHEMMDNSAKIERTLRGDFDLHYILRDLKMDLKSLNHKLSVVKEKLSI